MKNQANVEVETYDSKIKENIEFVIKIEKNLIRPLLDLVNIRNDLCKIFNINDVKKASEELIRLCNKNVL